MFWIIWNIMKLRRKKSVKGVSRVGWMGGGRQLNIRSKEIKKSFRKQTPTKVDF